MSLYNVFSVASVCAFFMIFSALAGPTQISVAEKTFRNDVNYPSVQVTLQSIEDRLRNLENSLSVQCEIAINGKIDYYGHKIDNIERDLSRFQVHMRMELDKISENISSKTFKDDITRDRTIRKIDTIYERINHKLGNIEGQIDMSEIKAQNAREMVMTKLEKMEESLTIRDADMEAELADAVAAIDDLKTTCTNMEENILNVTKETTKTLFKSSEKSAKKQHSQTINFLENSNKSLSVGLANIQQTVTFLLNQTNNSSNVVKRVQDDLDENLNEFANKVTDMYADLWKRTDDLDNTMQNLAKIANLTRNEQQNGLRALMVQVGRKLGKQGVQSDSSIDNQKLAELSQKIDANFENVMLAQNLFLESCHRVQMDEAQLESQISIVLDKLIEVFENKTAVGPKDIEQLGHLIRTHDSNIRRSIYQITNNLLALMQKTTDGNDDIIDYVNNQRLQLEGLYTLLQDVLNSSNDSEQTHSILETLQGFQQQLTKTHNQTHTTLSQINSTNNFIIKLLNAAQSGNSSTNTKLQQTLEFIKNIYHILTSIEMKINKSYLDYFFNKYNIDVIAHRFGKKLNDYIQSIDSSNITKVENKTNVKDDHQIPKLIFEIFGENPNRGESVDPYDDFPYTIESNLSKSSSGSGDEIENIVLLCDGENKNADCNKINTTKYTIVKQNDTNTLKNNCLPNYIDVIDVRSNSGIDSSSNCTFDAIPDTSANITKNLEKSENIPNECLPNSINLIDVRSSDGTNTTSNCTNTTINSINDSTNSINSRDEDLESYDIDVRYEKSNEILNNLNNTSITLKNNPKNMEVEPSDLSEDTSTKLDFTTEKLGTTKPSTTEVPESLSTHEANNILEEIDQTTQEMFTTDGLITITAGADRTDNSELNGETTLASDGEERTTEENTTEENYGMSSLEEESTETISEFEYTNHEYH